MKLNFATFGVMLAAGVVWAPKLLQVHGLSARLVTGHEGDLSTQRCRPLETRADDRSGQPELFIN